MTIQQEACEKIMKLPEDGVRLILVAANEIARQHGISPEEDTYALKESEGVRIFKRLDAARTEIKQYLPDNFDMEQELEEARSER